MTIFLLVATACSSTVVIPPSAEEAPTEPSATNEQATEFSEDEYCASLAVLFDSEPEGFDADELEAFAVLLDDAAAIAPAEHQEALSDAAAANRDPSLLLAEGATEEAEQAITPILDYADTICGLEDSSPTDRETSASLDGPSASFETSGSESADRSIPEGPGSENPRPQPTTQDPAARLASVTSALPAGSDLTFEWITAYEDGEPDFPFDVLVPVSWPIEAGSFDVTASTGFASMEFRSGCQGICVPQPWIQVMDDPSASPFAIFASSDHTVLLRQELANPAGRLLVTSSDGPFGELEITLTRWSDDADAFFQCDVELDLDQTSLWPAFADACIAAVPGWF